MKKYKLLKSRFIIQNGIKLFRIKALINTGINIKKGDLGGYIEKEENLSHEQLCWVYEGARVSGDARVYGDAWVYGGARVCEKHKIKYGVLVVDISNNKNIEQNIECAFNIRAIKECIILYKRVSHLIKGEYMSCYDSNFTYKDGKIARAIEPDLSTDSCASGLHASTPEYWNEGNCLIAVEIKIKDIITVQEGKVRCKKLKVLGEVNL